MAITAAQVEANGWVLRLTLTGSPSSATVSGFASTPDTFAQWATNFSAYALNPNGATPALTLALMSNGFVPSGGAVAASAAVSRSLVATRTLRRPVVATPAGVRDAKTPHETDNGDGTITVRIALSQHVYAGDSGLTLTALAGWRAGSTAQTIAVTNNSTIAAPQPIVRWSDVTYQLQSGSFTLECAVASHHPNGVVPVAGVRFAVTDGTTTKTFWATALSTSASYGAGGTGQGLRVYAITVDPTTATALTKGLLRCDFKVFPWIGPARCSDTGDTNLTGVAASNTPSMAGLGTAGIATAAQVPFVVAYNPGNTWITPLFVDIDTTTGTSTVASVTVATSAAGAAAGTAAIDLGTAINALRAYGATLTAQHGQAASSISCDGATITIRKTSGAVVGVGTPTIAGPTTDASWLMIRGDPTDGSGGKTCILRGPAANSTVQVSRIRCMNLTIESTGASFTANSAAVWYDNFECRGATGFNPTGGVPAFTATGMKVHATNGRWWQQSFGLTYASYHLPVLIRNVAVERSINAPAIFNCARLPTAASVSGASSNHGIANTGGTLTDAGFALERMAIGNDLRYLCGSSAMLAQTLLNANAPASLLLGKGTAYDVASRFAWLNNTGEFYNGAAAMWFGIGELNQTLSTEYVVEGNTFTGDRVAPAYNLPKGATIAATDTLDNVFQVIRFANNITVEIGTKHDRYVDNPGAGAQRIGVALGTAATRSKAYALGDELVLITSAGVSSNVYRCSQAGTSANSGGPTGTGTGIVDGTAKWDFFATETRQHGYRPQATGGWPLLYGVGLEGNLDVNSLSTWTGGEVAFEFFGLGSRSLWSDIYLEPTSPATPTPTSTPFTNDKSGGSNKQTWQTAWTGPAGGTPGGGGDYRPLATGTGAYTIGRGRSANVDVDQAGVPRAVPFAAGAFGFPSYALTPASGRAATRAAIGGVAWTATLAAASGAIATRATATTTNWTTLLATRGGALATRAAATLTGWTAQLRPANAALATRAAATLVGWTAQLRPANSAMATRAAVTLAAWTAQLRPANAALATRAATTLTTWTGQLGARSGTLATRAAATLVGWATQIVPRAAAQPSRAQPGATGWTTTLAVNADRSAMLAAAGLLTWRGTLSPAAARSAMVASGSIATGGGQWLFAVDSGRIAISDKTLPILLPGTLAPPARTLIVTGDFRTMMVP